MHFETVIVGAGPAGLSAAYLLSKNGHCVKVIEMDPKYLGGISRTVHYKGFLFDIGGHRFFSKSQRIRDFWQEILPPQDFLIRPRVSRILYRGTFFSYPLRIFEALRKLGIRESLLCAFSFVGRRTFPIKNERSFQDWVKNRFGDRLFATFFKTYTEKVWGIDCSEISSDWASQRIQNLNLFAAVRAALPKFSKNSTQFKTLIDRFHYPRRGPGMMWETCANKITRFGGSIDMGRKVTSLDWNTKEKNWTVLGTDSEGKEERCTANHIIYSGALGELPQALKLDSSSELANACAQLKYRDFVLVALIVKNRKHLADNWIYIHEPNVKVGRIQNYRSWSEDMVPNENENCYGMEYFCNENEPFWNLSDDKLLDLAKKEIQTLGLAETEDIVDGTVVRQKRAYPVYDDGYQEHVRTIREQLAIHFPTLHCIGRNGMHRYNNQDHSMMTGLIVAENILAGRECKNPWLVNTDAEYLEQDAPSDRLVPMKLQTSPIG